MSDIFPENIYSPKDFKDFLESKEFNKRKIFTADQTKVLIEIMDMLWYYIDDWHNENDDECHKDIREQLSKLEARFRNHRHETSRNFCGKAEY